MRYQAVMNRFTTRITILFLLVFSLIFTISCPIGSPIVQTGALSITSLHPDKNDSILPQEGSLSIASYSIQGTGPDGATIGEASNTTGNFSVILLIPGEWTIDIIGKDSSQKVLVHGSTVITVQAGKTTETTVALLPSEGSGTLDLTMVWTESLLVDSVAGTLISPGGSEQEIIFTITGYSASYMTNLSAGTYTLVIESSHEDTIAAPTRTLTVYIYDGLTSSGTINLESTIPKFKLLNSWGTGGWENVDDGYLWMTAEVMKEVRLFAMFQENLIDYEPRYILTFSMDHASRADIESIFVDLYESTQAYSEGYIQRKHFTPYGLLYTEQGGSEAFPSDTIAMDITEWSDELNSTRKIVLWVKERADSVLGRVENFSLEVYNGYENAPLKTITSSDTPVDTIDNDWAAVTIDLSSLTDTAKSTRAPQPPSLLEDLFITRGITDHEFNELKKSIGVRDPEVDYNHIINGYGTGLAPPTEDQWLLLRESLQTLESKSSTRSVASLPDSLDLMADPAFPPVGNQGMIGSCVAFSNTYYIGTFLEAKERGWNLSNTTWVGGAGGYPSDNLSRIMSPSFVYNLINGGVDNGAYYTEAAQIMSELGNATWETMPYYEGLHDPDDPSDAVNYTAWPTEAAWREAPQYRTTISQNTYSLSSPYYYLTVDTDADIEILRQLIAAGIPISVSIDANKYEDLSADDVWGIGNYDSLSTNHANTIVGYEF